MNWPKYDKDKYTLEYWIDDGMGGSGYCLRDKETREVVDSDYSGLRISTWQEKMADLEEFKKTEKYKEMVGLSDRTSAANYAQLFEWVAKNQPDNTELVKFLWKSALRGDFQAPELHCEEALEVLGLAGRTKTEENGYMGIQRRT